jgi:hypothetical protein
MRGRETQRASEEARRERKLSKQEERDSGESVRGEKTGQESLEGQVRVAESYSETGEKEGGEMGTERENQRYSQFTAHHISQDYRI